MKKNAKKKFRPWKIPRYLIGSVSPQIIKSDLEQYNGHRYKVFSAQTKIDTKPPVMNPYTYINVTRLHADAQRVRAIDMENKKLLKAINTINRTIGFVDSYNPAAYASTSKWNAHVKKMKMIETNNKAIYRLIRSARPNYPKKDAENYWNHFLDKVTLSARFPLTILKKKSLDAEVAKQPSISCGLEKLSERPLCFLEFQVLNGEFLGRVEIELYHDHVPVTVQNFVALCTGNNKSSLSYKNCLIHRIVPEKLLETGDITHGTGRGGVSIYGESFPEEGHKLKHTKPGALSMSRVGKNNNNSRFCISFNTMESLDRQNVVFGRIVKGIENLFKIQGYGRKIGKPLMPVVISNCGELKVAPSP